MVIPLLANQDGDPTHPEYQKQDIKLLQISRLRVDLYFPCFEMHDQSFHQFLLISLFIPLFITSITERLCLQQFD